MTLTGPMKDALDLAQRFQQNELFQHYVVQRIWLVIPAAVVLLATSLALAFGIVAFVGGTRSFMVFVSLLLAPFALVGSLFVQGYVFLSWLEERAIARTLGRRAYKSRGRVVDWLEKKLKASLGTMPRMPWLLVGVFIILPFAALLFAAPKIAIAVAALQLALPLAYARLDR